MKNSWMLVVMFSMDLAFCQESLIAVPEPSLNPSVAKENLQTSYALKVAQLTINAIYTFKQKYHPRVPRQEDVDWFTRELLNYGEDKLVQAVKYVPNKSLTIIMQDNEFVAALLRSAELELSYYPENDLWKTTRRLPTIAATGADFLSRDISMGLITDYCVGPQENFGFPGMLPDIQWCPAWLQFVMPSPQ